MNVFCKTICAFTGVLFLGAAVSVGCFAEGTDDFSEYSAEDAVVVDDAAAVDAVQEEVTFPDPFAPALDSPINGTDAETDSPINGTDAETDSPINGTYAETDSPVNGTLSVLVDEVHSLAAELQSAADEYTLYTKPFNEYSPVEGYLFIITVVLLSVLMYYVIVRGILL